MLFVMIAIVVYALPWILYLVSVIDARNGKIEKPRWKLPFLLLVLLTAVGIGVQLYLRKAFSFAFFQNGPETYIILGIIGLICGIILLINLIVTKTAGKNMPKSFHDPKAVNWIALGFALFFFTMFFIGVPSGKKIGFAYNINQAITQTEQADAEEFAIVLVRSERECLRRTATCRNSDYSNQFFIRNKMDTPKEVQVKIRILDSNGLEAKVIDSKVMTLEPGEVKMIETEETREDSSVWNQYSFQTEYRISTYEYFFRYRDPGK